MYRVTIIPGDGIGPEIVQSARNLSKDFPEIELEEINIDAQCLELVRDSRI